MYMTRIMAKATRVRFMTALSLPISSTVAQAATVLLGQIRLPREAPAFYPAKMVMGFMPREAAASMCIWANMMLEPSPVPVMKAPLEPMSTAAAG